MKRILWGITGSGDRIDEIVGIMDQVNAMEGIKLNIIISKAGEQMLRRYSLWEKIESSFRKVTREVNSNVPFVAGPLQVGHYALLVVAPLTANSTAKIALGIADTLVTNAVAQTLKGNTPVLLYPVDQNPGTVETTAPDGMQYTIRTREVDLRNAEMLRQMEGVTVVPSPEHIFPAIKRIIKVDG
ncbi:MAG: archaeoflavoprotein AfpA [Candidatus Thorarchaeota archaeon]